MKQNRPSYILSPIGLPMLLALMIISGTGYADDKGSFGLIYAKGVWGPMIVEITAPGSPADKVLEPGDTITRIDNFNILDLPIANVQQKLRPDRVELLLEDSFAVTTEEVVMQKNGFNFSEATISYLQKTIPSAFQGLESHEAVTGRYFSKILIYTGMRQPKREQFQINDYLHDNYSRLLAKGLLVVKYSANEDISNFKKTIIAAGSSVDHDKVYIFERSSSGKAILIREATVKNLTDLAAILPYKDDSLIAVAEDGKELPQKNSSWREVYTPISGYIYDDLELAIKQAKATQNRLSLLVFCSSSSCPNGRSAYTDIKENRDQLSQYHTFYLDEFAFTTSESKNARWARHLGSDVAGAIANEIESAPSVVVVDLSSDSPQLQEVIGLWDIEGRMDNTERRLMQLIAAGQKTPSQTGMVNGTAQRLEEEILNKLSKRINPTGVVYRDGNYILLFNSGKMKAGDKILVNFGGVTHTVEFAEINLNSYTIKLGQAALTRKHEQPL